LSHRFGYYETPYGIGAFVFTERGLGGLVFPRDDCGECKAFVLAKFSGARYDEDLNRFGNLLSLYFEGKPVGFGESLDLSGFSLFEKEVYLATLTIPYGETRSYGWLAKAIGRPRACRAVGSALGRNPIPVVIPCHRVIRGDGSLGGFSAGLLWKKRLLALEGVECRGFSLISSNGCDSMSGVVK